MKIRLSIDRDASSILNIYAKARSFMAEHGNPNQWTKGAPDGKSLQKDLLNQASFVVEEEGKMVGTFTLYHDDPNYCEIQGSWLNDEPYVVIHRITSMSTERVKWQVCYTLASSARFTA